MNDLTKKLSLKEINLLKKKITWGEVSAIYYLFSSSISELDGILSDGFDSSYKTILDRNTWNLQILKGYRDSEGNVHVKIKPKIILTHHYNELGYELLCNPIIEGVRVNHSLIREYTSPFQTWLPESMSRLFRISNLVAFSIYTYQNGDDADLALIEYAYLLVEKLIKILSESFEIVEVEGYNIAEFYQEIERQNGNILSFGITPCSPDN
jgi:hypothetical protein